MTAWVYIKSERGLYTVGFYDPLGVWHSDSDHMSPEAARGQVAMLNGASDVGVRAMASCMKLGRALQQIEALPEARLDEAGQIARAALTEAGLA